METPYDYSKEARTKRKDDARAKREAEAPAKRAAQSRYKARCKEYANKAALVQAKAERDILTPSLAALKERADRLSSSSQAKRHELVVNRIEVEQRRLNAIKAKCVRLTERLRLAAYRRETAARASQDGPKGTKR